MAAPIIPPSLSEDLLKKVRQIEYTTRRMINDVVSGNYRSQFKGHGMQFSEHRNYVDGDDIRHIDWKASARKVGDPLIKKYEEERELTVLLLVDVSGSQEFGSQSKLKREVAAEVAGMMAYAAVHTGDKVGMLLFADGVEKTVPPKKGKSHVLRLVRDVLSHRSPVTGTKHGTDLAGALENALRVMKHTGVVFVISDFMAEGYASALKRLAKKHDVIAIDIADPRESEVPAVGIGLFVDAETGEEFSVDTGSFRFRKWLKESIEKRESALAETLKGSKVERLKLSTAEDYPAALVKYFRARAQRGSRR